MTDILNNLMILGGLIVALIILYAGATYLWNRKYVPAQLVKGKLQKPLGLIFKEVHAYTFKEDTGNLLKKASPSVQKITSYKKLHLLLIVAGMVAFVITGSWYALLTLPFSFIIGFSRAMPIIKKRTVILDRIFLIASSSIKFTAGPRAKNAAPPASWNHITVEKWQGKDTPAKMVITFPSGNGPEQQAQKSFQKSFEINVTDENIWNFEWDLPHDRVTIEAAPHLPTQLAYPGSEGSKWSVFPVGESSAGVASYDVSVFPHVLVGGPSGTGKSVLQRNIVFHTIQHNDRWRFLGVDLKRVELTPYNKYKKTVMGIATDVEQGVAVLKYAYNEMMDRYKEMEGIGVNNVMDMADPPYCILLMVDEATMFLGASGSKTDEGKAEDAMKGEAADLVGKILRLGRAAGIHMLIAMQRPDATVLRGEFKANMDVRMAAGRMDSTPSAMILDSGEAVNLPGIKGRGLIRVGGNLTVFQGYFAPQDWIDDFILRNPHAEPSTIAPGGHLHEKYAALKRLEAAKDTAPDTGDDENTETQSENEETSSPKKLSIKGFKKGKKDQETESAPPVPVSAPVEKPDNSEEMEPEFKVPTFDLFPDEEPVTENHQSLLESLGKKEDGAEEERTNEVPDFFTGSAKKDSGPVREVEPDLTLEADDFIFDDFEDDDSTEQDAEEENPEAPPADIMPAPVPAKTAKPKTDWVSASPWDDDTDEPEEPQLPFETVKETVKPAAAPFQKPVRPAMPEAPVPVQAETVLPKRPTSPFAPKAPTKTINSSPFAPRNTPSDRT